jgi:hypothetical protein
VCVALEAYGQHPDVLLVDADSVFGGGDDITLCNDTVGGTHRYLFTRGSGDCLAGCTHWAYRGYDVTEAGEVTRLEPSWQRDSMADEKNRPDWVLPGCFPNP